jgi:hypothetical protein
MSEGAIITQSFRNNHSSHSVVTGCSSATILKGLFDLVCLSVLGRGQSRMTILTIRKHQRFAVRREAGLLAKGRVPRSGLLVELSLEGCRMSINGAAKYAIGQALKIEVQGYGKLHCMWRT